MENTVIQMDSVHKYNQMKGVETLHPLVNVIDLSTTQDEDLGDTRVMYGIYALFLKEVDCGNLIYGRQNYDYQEGSIVCLSPGQLVGVVRHGRDYKPKGWALVFHPDLVRGTSLGRNLQNYSYFSYQVNEALHLSDSEKRVVKEVLHIIRTELEHPVDKHSKTLIVNNVELLLNYCNRFYERQFITRSDINKDILVRFENLLHDYYQEGKQLKSGVPTVKYCASELYLSPNYFGDLIKKETGKTAQEFIQDHVMGRAKDLVVGSPKTITEIAYELGFQYPTHFNRLFKKLTDYTPVQYRKNAK